MSSDGASKVGGASSSPVRAREQDAPATMRSTKVGGASSSPFWEYFNPMAEIDIRNGGDLPHWEQGSVWYFVTFRLADALPRAIVDELRTQRERWLQSHDLESLSPEDVADYHRLFSERYENLLNAGSGACLLHDRENAGIVRDAFHFFDGQRYVLDEHVVMPNHIHVLVKPLAGHGLADILHSWKSFTANRINRRMKRAGSLWQHESYDHIVRNELAMNAVRRYIRENPNKVGGVSSSPVITREQDAPATIWSTKVGGASSSPVLPLPRELEAPATLAWEQDAPATMGPQ